MRRTPRLVLAGVAAGGALAALLVGGPAAAAPTGPNTSECINAKAILGNAQTAQVSAQAAYNAAVKARDAALDAYNDAISNTNPDDDAAALAKLNQTKNDLLTTTLILEERVKAVTVAQTNVDKLCATVTVPGPTTTVTVPPTSTTTRPPAAAPSTIIKEKPSQTLVIEKPGTPTTIIDGQAPAPAPVQQFDLPVTH